METRYPFPAANGLPDGAPGVMPLTAYDLQCISQAHHLLSKDPPPHITIEALALEVGINRNKLYYGFKQVYGLTIQNFQERHRMQKAEHLLSTTYKSVKIIAAITGYCTSSRLVAVFKKYFGMTPLQYRKQLKSFRRNNDI